MLGCRWMSVVGQVKIGAMRGLRGGHGRWYTAVSKEVLSARPCCVGWGAASKEESRELGMQPRISPEMQAATTRGAMAMGLGLRRYKGEEEVGMEREGLGEIGMALVMHKGR